MAVIVWYSSWIYFYLYTIKIFLFPIKEPFQAEQLTKNLIQWLWIDYIDWKMKTFYETNKSEFNPTIDIVIVAFELYAISAYHHWCYEFESRSGRGVQHYVINIVIDLRQVGGFLRVLRFPPPIKLTATIYVDSGIKQHQTNKHVPDSVNTKFQCPVWSPIMWNLSKQNPE